LLEDPDIDAIYNPLPNHLHLPWSMRAAEAGKHVLCEKPIGLTTDEARQLIAVRDRTGVKMQEGFMVRTHPQWLKALDICRSGELGKIQSFMGHFSFYNDRPENIRNVPEFGGGALMDVGCYLILASRLVFGEEPRRVMASSARSACTSISSRRCCSTFRRARQSARAARAPFRTSAHTCLARNVTSNRDSVQRATRSAVPDVDRRRPQSRSGGVRVETVDEINFETCNHTRSRARRFRARFSRTGTCRIRSK
jgi:predicted dehydrogenase